MCISDRRNLDTNASKAGTDLPVAVANLSAVDVVVLDDVPGASWGPASPAGGGGARSPVGRGAVSSSPVSTMTLGRLGVATVVPGLPRLHRGRRRRAYPWRTR